MQCELDDPAHATAEFDGFQGRTTFEAAVDRFLCFDQVVHGWDLGARRPASTSTSTRRRRRACASSPTQFGDALRSPQAFGAEPSTRPPMPTIRARLLVFLGRNP